ncbi:MAG: hypothetical protein K8I02_04310, partial [Candidatus Methylomirabilis sp.]|nr:hypothetical protein [Deltaproteobacteria bacterium]
MRAEPAASPGAEAASVEPATVDLRAAGAIGDGRSHPLSTRFASVEAARERYPTARAPTDELDRLAFEAAVARLGERGGGELRVPPGEYLLDRQVRVDVSNLRIVGEDREAVVLRRVGDEPGFLLHFGRGASVSGVALSRVTLVGRANARGGGGVAFGWDGP